jgi:hypothetical protein
LYEDDGVSLSYQEGGFAITPFRLKWKDKQLCLTIGPADGRIRHIPDSRTYNVVFRGVLEPRNHTVSIDDKEILPAGSYNRSSSEFSTKISGIKAEQKIEIILEADSCGLLKKEADILKRCRKILFSMNVRDVVKRDIDNALLKEISLAALKRHIQELTPGQIRALTETICNCSWEDKLL